MKSQRIPLGRLASDPETIIYKPLTTMSDTFFWFARPGVGKTVVMKLVVFMLWMAERPVVIFDPTGMDHRLSFKANTNPKNLPPGVSPLGMDKHPTTGCKVKYLNVADRRYPWEEKYIPNIHNLEASELRSFGFSAGAIDELKKVLSQYGPFNDFDDLIQFVNKFPINPMTAKTYAKRFSMGREKEITNHHTFYREGIYMNQQTKSNLMRILYKISEEKILALNDDFEFDVLEWVKKGNSVVFSFNRNYELTRAVVSVISKKIIEWKTYGGYGVQPWIIFEEMDKILPQFPRTEEKEVVENNTELILQLRKLSIGIGGSSASLIRTDLNIIENAHNCMFGQIKGRNLNRIGYVYNDEIANSVKYLFWNRYTNKREFLYVDEFSRKFKVIPFESPCEIHREFRKKKQ